MATIDLFITKVLVAALLGGASLLGALLPSMLVWWSGGPSGSAASGLNSRGAAVLSLLTCCSAGLLIGAGLLHFMAECIARSVAYFERSDVSEGAKSPKDLHAGALERGTEAALVFLTLGLLIPLFVDSVMLRWLRRPTSGKATTTSLSHQHHQGSHCHGLLTLSSGDPAALRAAADDGGGCAVDMMMGPAKEGGGTPPVLSPAGSSAAAGANGGVLTSTPTVVIAVLLSLHSCFEGLALGVEDSVAALRAVAVAMALHKVFDGAILGISLAKSLARRKVAGTQHEPLWRVALKNRTLVLWAMVTPVVLLATALWNAPRGSVGVKGLGGRGGGAEVDENCEAPPASLWSAALQGIGAGTFLYIALVEIIPDEFNNSSHDATVGDQPTGVDHRLAAAGAGGVEGEKEKPILSRQQPRLLSRMVLWRFVALVLGVGFCGALRSMAHHHDD